MGHDLSTKYFFIHM